MYIAGLFYLFCNYRINHLGVHVNTITLMLAYVLIYRHSLLRVY